MIEQEQKKDSDKKSAGADSTCTWRGVIWKQKKIVRYEIKEDICDLIDSIRECAQRGKEKNVSYTCSGR